MRIAFCIDNMNVGGTELNAVRTAEQLVERGVELHVFSLTAEGPLRSRYASLGVPVHGLPLRSLHDPEAVRRGWELASIVRRARIGIVHAHDFYSNIFAGPWTRMSGAAFIASRRWWEGPERRLQRWANRCSYALAHRVLVNSPAIGRLLVETERVRPSRVVVVPNFLDDAAFQAPSARWRDALASELRLPEQRQVVGVVASLSPIKDHATLLRAAAALVPSWPDLYFVLVGADNGSRSELEGMSARLGIADRVRFAGLRPSQPSAHHFFDVSVLTSISEGLPNTVLEAMAAGRPVVATDVGAVSDAVLDGATGFLVPSGDDNALSRCLAKLLNNSVLRSELGKAGESRAAEHYRADKTLRRLLAVYRGVRNGGGRNSCAA